MIELKRKSVIPIYGFVAVWVLYCAIFPLYRTWHFIALACSAVLANLVLSILFPGKTERIEIPKEPERSGNEAIDALLSEGERAVEEMRNLRDTIQGELIKGKIDDVITVTDMIFRNLLEDPDDLAQTRRFANFYLPTTVKLLHTYDRFGRSGDGENVTGTMERIDQALDTILESYRKFYDSLFENQALDIETDIIVLENMLRTGGLLK